MWSRDASSTYGLLWDYEGTAGPGYKVYNLATRTVVYSTAAIARPWSFSTYSGPDVQWSTIDHQGTLWGHDYNELVPVLISSGNYGQDPLVVHGLWTMNDQANMTAIVNGVERTTNPNASIRYMEAFKANNGTPVICWSTSWGPSGYLHNDRYCYMFFNGTITSMKPSVVTGVAFQPSQHFIQDEYGDIWNVGHQYEGATKAYFWRVFANGTSPIVGDLHTVTVAEGLPATRPLEGVYGFNPCWHGKRQGGEFVIWWEGQWNNAGTPIYDPGDVNDTFTNGLGSRYYAKINSSTWTVSTVKYFDTNLNLGSRWAEYRNPETPNSNYLLVQYQYPFEEPAATWEMYDLRDGSFTSYQPFFEDWGISVAPDSLFFLDYDLKHEPAIVITDYATTLWWIGFIPSGAITGGVNVGTALAGSVADPPPPQEVTSGGAKVIDLRDGRGDLIILGKTLTLPSSDDDTNHIPVDGSIRFNPLTGWPQLFADGAWTNLGGGGGTAVWSVADQRLLGRTSSGTGPVQQLQIGTGLALSGNTLSYTISETKPPFLTGGHTGTLSSNQKILIGFAPTVVTLSVTNTSARSLVAPTADYRLAIMRKTTGLNPVEIGSFDWTAGNKLAVTTITDPALAELDFVYLEGAAIADGALQDLAFVFRSA